MDYYYLEGSRISCHMYQAYSRDGLSLGLRMQPGTLFVQSNFSHRWLPNGIVGEGGGMM